MNQIFSGQVFRQPNSQNQGFNPSSSQLTQQNSQIRFNQEAPPTSLQNSNFLSSPFRVQQNQNQNQLPQQVSRVQNNQNPVVQPNNNNFGRQLSSLGFNKRTAPAISAQPRYKEFVRLVDNEVLRKQDSVLGDEIPGFEEANFKLLYQGTRDGFTTEQLQKRLESKTNGNSFTFILSNHGQVFGGFSQVKRTFPEFETNIFDPLGFLFQLNKKKIILLDHSSPDKRYSVTHRSDYLYQGFVLPQELRSEVIINPGSDGCDEQEQELDHVDIDEELQEKRSSYMAGARIFTVDEIEIYEIEQSEW
eukprot:403358040